MPRADIDRIFDGDDLVFVGLDFVIAA